MIDYQKILNTNMLNVFKDVLKDIENNGLTGNNHLYITFLTSHKEVEVPSWLKERYPHEMTIVIQYEYYDLCVNQNNFSITLSFNDIKENLQIGYNSVISFADPLSNFGLVLKNYKEQKKNRENKVKSKINKNNIIDFSDFKKN